jgi:pimeloyl-ACP methyl ester carboxylesterase
MGMSDEMKQLPLARWRSRRAERRCRALEDSLWTSAPESVLAPTRFGSTQAYRWPGSGVPLVLLHGGAVTSITWEPIAEAMPDRDVYALDIMGDVGRSEHTAPFSDVTELATWLDDALAALHLNEVQLVGHSLGGWVAINAAVRRPDRLESLVLIDPGGVVPLQMGPFMRWGFPVMASSFMPGPVRRRVARRMHHPLAVDKRWTRLMLLGVLWHKPGFPPLQPLFADDELASIGVPTSLIAGELTEMFDTSAMADRLRCLVPNIDVTIVEGGGHALTVSHVHECVAAIDADPGAARPA